MAQAPNTLQASTPYTETISLMNDNAQKVVNDIGDLGAKFSTSVGTFSVTLSGGNITSVSVGVQDGRPQYVAGNVQIVPRVDTWVDNDGDDDYLLGFGGSLSAGQAAALVSVWPARRPPGGDVAAFVVQIQNLDSSSHTYFGAVDESYINSPPTGQFR